MSGVFFFKRKTADDLLISACSSDVCSSDLRILNDDGLRYEAEFVRHKILDALGDLYLTGAPIIGRYDGRRSGHALNNKLLQALFADQGAFAWTTHAKGRDAVRVLPAADIGTGLRPAVADAVH